MGKNHVKNTVFELDFASNKYANVTLLLKTHNTENKII